MKENRINATIAIATVVAAVLMAAALSFAIGKWSLGNSGYDVIIQFPNATGITPNSAVKFAGAEIGRVKEVRLIPRKDQQQDPLTKQFDCIEVVASIKNDVEIGEDSTAVIKQDGFGISAKYVLIEPGENHDSKALADGAHLQGQMPFDLSDLVQPAGVVLEQTKSLISTLQPVMTRLDSLSQKMETDLPPLITNANKFLQDGDSVLSNLSTPESRDRINNLLASLRVASENLKVVSSNAKALTATLAQKPWRVFWGGSTVAAPTESEVLKSNVVIPLKPDVDVQAAPNAKKKSTTTPAEQKPAGQIN
jgi:phospholipid/cholesterol/gamma-HCH transport system substrate-binding protein